ncbi:hypothetical protein BD414DRAFT_517357 [Trametes punicea]|nr:hypothetical protein BD414DRAFT_517357 [Trametes punicea]
MTNSPLTPPRRPQFYTPKAEFETPPPPRGMPDLPGPPSDDDNDHTPVMQSRDIQGDSTALKTPRPPGAWLSTPAPSRQSTKEPIERAGSAPPAAEQQSSSFDGRLASPSSALSRAGSLPPQTPAPPGGWVNTPAPDTSARKRGILKVRFEVESETASEGAFEKPSVDSSTESKAPDSDIRDASWGVAANAKDDTSGSSVLQESSVAPPPSPPSLRQRIRQKSPSIRVLDAYGREQVEPPSASDAVHDTDLEDASAAIGSQAVASATPRRKRQSSTPVTPRTRSAVRMVDAMGREIEEESVQEDDSVLRSPLTRSEALSRIRETLSSMAEELNDIDRTNDRTVFDARSYASLEERCRAAEVARSKITKTLQMAQMAEVELRSKYPLSQDKARGNVHPSTAWLSRSFLWRLLTGFVILQVVFLAIMYRYSLVQARKMYLTTFYDPIYPELHHYLVKPDTSRHTIPQCPSWSLFSAFGHLRYHGLKSVAADVWASTSCSISSYLQAFWFDVNYNPDTRTHSWPPT